ncbi:hypothetical protein [Streptomyces rapamycinicus]|uniref:site-specific DNA-methyltransferase (cytosine-N(4)-specific) n=2 Tax=Streptomyces rapamycinicus TaxID=1226757 RepID=A0A3L8RFX1_STRRN|nr:hypothetical protein [Streptomyces rapamycinicus]MBB4786056.1 hypothetical protein [Streptomyces rapamycinicus]RLV78481.1 DNA modification methylase [Streptomyces rapamycinicus NRRL 5491]UTO66178.1 hypothetical protein LJB45_30215 [Streptomyces rapamycinicus]UTP34132.1 hypothetical protein LIV37_35350 [Streptomyces rapamycinicus NRRL 5491]
MIFPYYADDSVTLYTGDGVEVLRNLPDDRADCVVTSPPYWGLRDYVTGTWTGGNPSCAHSTGHGTNAAQHKHPSLEYPASTAHRGGAPRPSAAPAPPGRPHANWTAPTSGSTSTRRSRLSLKRDFRR